jgi:hypothetical protein
VFREEESIYNVPGTVQHEISHHSSKETLYTGEVSLVLRLRNRKGEPTL